MARKFDVQFLLWDMEDEDAGEVILEMTDVDSIDFSLIVPTAVDEWASLPTFTGNPEVDPVYRTFQVIQVLRIHLFGVNLVKVYMDEERSS